MQFAYSFWGRHVRRHLSVAARTGRPTVHNGYADNNGCADHLDDDSTRRKYVLGVL
jgi:hypothetical protein